MPVIGSTGVTPTFKDGGASLVNCLDVFLVELTVRLALQRGAMPNRVLVNVGMTWPWQADGGRFVSLSWALVGEHAMVTSTVPTQMLGAEVLRWLTGACLVK
jgi:hypothetical protein